MAISVQLDVMASAFVHAVLSRQLSEIWLSSNPTEEQIAEFVENARAAIKNAHSENSLPDDVELALIDRMSIHLEAFVDERIARR